MKTAILIVFGIVIALYTLELIARWHRLRLTPMESLFSSDGCTGVPEANWGECCEAHDFAYFTGGTMLDRWLADVELFKCIGRNKNWFAAVVYFLGVRLLGMWRFHYEKKLDIPPVGE